MFAFLAKRPLVICGSFYPQKSDSGPRRKCTGRTLTSVTSCTTEGCQLSPRSRV